MGSVNWERPMKCFFCEYDKGPLSNTVSLCNLCFNFNRFKPKTRMHPRQYHEWQRYKEWEETQK